MSSVPVPDRFKGIALFTPGGDAVYCIDPAKQKHWHVQLCTALQAILDLPEPPHFLVPAYTATIDRWRDPDTQDLRWVAELYPPVRQYQLLLNAMFQTPGVSWQVVPWRQSAGNPILLAAYRQQFPQLWEYHNLLVQVGQPQVARVPLAAHPWTNPLVNRWPLGLTQSQPAGPIAGYALRLFVSDYDGMTEKILHNLRQVLEHSLAHPYTLKVISVVKHPEQAEQDQITATPTLVKLWPPPVRKIVGDLGTPEQILSLLSSPVPYDG
ncbi:circadian clock KaiB family protein [Trichothermofontia sichuanensis]|uniref:circadian clock KaiB family protein n=1 Tax=Trichothermofontia sichuanensis TaxID=3045816 RepID=UPI00249E375E|nr:circadian clock KaiB family protein [Trichothermofontia sichuanensis]